MVRQTVDEYHIDGVRVTITFDSGGPVGANTVVSIGKRDDWFVNRWFYFDEDNENYVRNFARKVATDGAYRERCLDRTADWARVADQYEETARQIHQYFLDAGVLGYTVGNQDEKRVYEAATDELEAICESLFSQVKSEIRGDTDTDTVDQIVEDHKDRAWAWLREREYLDDQVATDPE